MNDRRNSVPVSLSGEPAPHAGGAWRWAWVAAAALFALLATGAALAQASEDLPGRVGRVADVTGELFIAPQDRPDAWQPVGINYPVTSGDNLWLGSGGRAEVDVGGGQFRFAGDTSIHVSQLDDHRFSLFVAQGRISVRVRALEPGDVATIDTPNAQVAITRPGLYRLEVTEDRQHTVVIVREGEVNVLTQAAVQQVLPGQAAYIDGADPQYANVQNGIGLDGFDTWVASRDRIYRVRGNNYVSPQMVGAADLDQYGTWTQAPEYGAVWFPNDVPADWAPYRNGYWVDVGTWGPTWVDYAPWGYAPFHYGRWAFIGGRWGWCPGVYTPRPLWAPALVAWTGGAGWSVSVTTGGPVYGWVPLSWGEPFRPWWGRCSTGCWDRFNRPYAVNVAVVRPWSPPPPRWRNASAPGGVTAVPFQAFQARQPVQQNLVRVPRDVVAGAPALASPPVMRTDPGRGFAQRPGTAPPPASTFQPAIARQAPATGAVPMQPRGGPVPGEAGVNRRPGMPVTAAPGAPAASPNVARPATPNAAPGSTFAPAQPGGRTTPVPGPAQPGQSVAVPGAGPREGRPQGTPQMGSPQTPGSVPQPAAAQPPMRGQPQQAGSSQPGQPVMRAQPQAAPPSAPQTAQPVTRPQVQPMPQAPSQPVMRAQPQPMPQAVTPSPVVRPQPQMTAPQAPPQYVPQQPVMRGQPPSAPQAAPPQAPAPRAAPQAPAQPAAAPAAPAEPGRPGTDGSINRGERGR